MLPCFFHKIFGIQCPGCGMQTAIIELLRGNVLKSIKIYPALLPTIAMFILLALHLKFNFKNGALYLKISFIFTAMIIIVNYIYKVITHNIF
ncbi:MAG: DUF2752 domain-containing protein [Bacteroidia bacterium]|nr:DUF2752 domain-containing protein [Bacteroidia bacterium]